MTVTYFGDIIQITTQFIITPKEFNYLLQHSKEIGREIDQLVGSIVRKVIEEDSIKEFIKKDK